MLSAVFSSLRYCWSPYQQVIHEINISYYHQQQEAARLLSFCR